METIETDKRKRIFFLDHTARLGGGEIALLHLVQALDKNYCTPCVVLFSDGPLQVALTDAGIETHVLPLAPHIGKTKKDSLRAGSLLRLRDAGVTAVYCIRLARFLRAQRAALVHTNSLKSDLIGGAAARLARVPLLWHVRDRIASDYLPGPVAALFRRLCRCVPRVVVANSAATLRTLLPADSPQTPANFHVVHDGVPPETLTAEDAETPPVPATVPSPVTAPCIGLVGRISPWKGQHIFLQAAADVLQRSPQARFQIIGAALFQEQEYEREIHALRASLGLEGRVEFTGFRPDVPALIAGLDILVHASTLAEPFGQVIIEGMAAGKPVIATDGGGVPEIVQDGITGILVPRNDAPALADAILVLLGDPAKARQMGRQGRRRVAAHFTTTLTARRLEAIYRQILGD